MNCTSCGTPLAENTRFCPRCGAVTPEDGPITAYFPEDNAPPYAEQLSFIDKDTPDAQKEGQQERPRPQQPEQQPSAQSDNELQVSDGKTLRAAPTPGWPQPAPQQGGQPGQPAPYPAGGPQASSSPQTPSHPAMRPQPQFPLQAPSYQGWGPMPQGYPGPQQSGNMPPVYGQQYQPQGYPGMVPQQPYPNWQPGVYPAVQPAAPPQTQWMRNLVIGLVALVVILALLLGVGGFIALQRSATPVTQAQATTQPAQPTSAPGAITTTNPQDLFTQVTSQTPTLNDNLNAQGAITWQGDNTAGDQCVFTGGALHVIGSKGAVPGCLDSAASFGNFAFQVKMTIIQGDSAGAVFIAHVSGNNFNQYEYSVSDDGSYAFSSISVDMQNHTGSNPQLLSGGRSSAINTAANQPNVLTLIARNQTIYLYINKQYITTITQAVTSASAIGFIGAGKAKQVPVDVACNNFQVWNI